jgi:hypothetical protein
VIQSLRKFCRRCGQITSHDRWTGERRKPNAVAGIRENNMRAILEQYRYIDALEQRVRAAHELVIDHRFPQARWGKAEPPLAKETTDGEIRARFQLLKKDGSGNHNQLKSRACEACIKTGKRGFPLGIKHFYKGGEDWPQGVPSRGPKAQRGCEGCGWYNLEKWRESLNRLVGKRTRCCSRSAADSGS